MEEIDKIIIETLKNLHCEIDKEVTSLKQFDADLTVASISTCLQSIIPDKNVKFPKKLPESMSTKLKIATNLAQQIKELGFRGDMGYQIILYCNEVEIRRVLMFLIEKLPRETSKIVQIEEAGYVPRLVKEIEDKIKLSLNQFWIPTSILNKGAKIVNRQIINHSFGDSCPLTSDKLDIPNFSTESDSLKQYWIHTLPDVTKQCHPRKLLPSLLFQDCDFTGQKLGIEKLPEIQLEKAIITEIKQITETTKDEENNLDQLIINLEEQRRKMTYLQESVQKYELQLSQNVSMKSEEEEMLQNTLSKIKIKSKTMTVMGKEENKLKLRNLVENGSDRLIELANQWNKVQTPLLEEYKSLQNNLSNEERKVEQEQTKLKQLKENYKNLMVDLKEKEVLEENLKEKCKEINKNNNRANYTRRILEIIANIKKQDNEITKILKDTKDVQKDINTLTGQVDRSFTLSDELIFRDAKNDETARKAYKLLAALRDECSDIIRIVTDLGLAERESRNLQEQVEVETTKETAGKLERVNKDLQEIRRETTILLKNT